MRLIAVILVAYISLLTVLPVICGTYIVLEQAELCCNSASDNQCSEEQSCNEQSDEENNNSSCISCCSVQNCNCNLVDVSRFNFLVQISLNSKRAKVENDKVISNYLSDCWQPPELV